MNATMQRTWSEVYKAVQEFVSQNDVVKVTPVSLTLPPTVRESFYEVVGEAQLALTQQMLGCNIERAREFSQRAAQMRDKLVGMTGLGALYLAPQLEVFFADPLTALSKPAFSLVLNGIQNGYSSDEIAEKSALKLPAFCNELIRNAYEAWAYYGIVCALDPVKMWGIESPDTVHVSPVETDAIVIASQVTSPERRIPEAVFETRDGRFFAMKTEAARELDFYDLKYKQRRDNSAGGNTAGMLCHRVLLLYQLIDVSDVAPIVDRQRHIQRPCDLMCEVLEPDDMCVPAYVSTFVNRINSLRIRRPVQVITHTCEGAFPCGLEEDEAVASLTRRTIGFDENALAQIAALLEKPHEKNNEMEEV